MIMRYTYITICKHMCALKHTLQHTLHQTHAAHTTIFFSPPIVFFPYHLHSPA
jgi:hypothetical protein